MTDAAIEVEGLRKAYGPHEAVRGISFTVGARRGVRASSGPNGAGKTTTVEILEGYRDADAGTIRVLGMDPATGGTAYRARIGIVLQASGVYPYMSVREAAELFAGWYPNPRPVGDVLAAVDLADQAQTRVRTLSGGQRRRLDVALALVGNPEVLFLDEPTTGFDPERAPRRLGDDRGPRRRRHDDPADDALHGRGAVARRPRGRDARGRDRRDGPAGVARRRRPAADPLRRARRAPRRRCWPRWPAAPSSPPATGSCSRSTTRPRALHILTGWALDRGMRPRAARGGPAEPRGRLPGADGGRSVRRYLRQVTRRAAGLLAQHPERVLHVLPADPVPRLPRPVRPRPDRRRPARTPTFFVPGMLGMAVVMTTFAGLAITLVIRRERGMLKRVRGTPLPPARVPRRARHLDRGRAGARGRSWC